MKKLVTILSIFLLAFLFLQCQEEAPTLADDPLALDKKINDDPGQDPDAPTPNLSFPVVLTDYVEYFYMLDEESCVQATDPVTGELLWQGPNKDIPVMICPWIEKAFPSTSIFDKYSGSYLGMDSFDYGIYLPGDDPSTTEVVEDCYWYEKEYKTFLDENKPWFPQFVNTWQADWKRPDFVTPVAIDFIDWGNPMENINPTVGYRFPVEVALYARLDETMTAYKMACLEYMSSRDELFGTTGTTYGSYYATVLTSQFEAWIIGPDGKRTNILLEPAVGPSGKMNFASAGGGWTPTIPGVHRVYLRITDPLISLSGAIVNNDEHYCMANAGDDGCGGCKMEDLSWKKQALSGVYYNDTWIDVTVLNPSGKTKK